MKKLISIVMAFCMFVCLMSGCTQKSELVGVWHAEIDLTDYINGGVGNAELSEYINISYFGFEYSAEFREDGVYKFQIDSEAAKEMYQQVREEFREGTTKYFEAMIEKNNANVTVDEMLTNQGTSMDLLVEDAFPDSKLQDLIDSLSSEGNFLSENGKLYLSPSLDTKPAKEKYEEYTLDGTTLTITAGNTATSGEFELFPMVFEKLS